MCDLEWGLQELLDLEIDHDRDEESCAVDMSASNTHNRNLAVFRGREIKDFAEIDDPYREPEHPEPRLTAEHTTLEENTREIVNDLMNRGFLRQAGR